MLVLQLCCVCTISSDQSPRSAVRVGLLGRASRATGEVVPHGAEEARLGLLVVEGLAAGHMDRVVAALLGHEALERRAGAAAAARRRLLGGGALVVHVGGWEF